MREQVLNSLKSEFTNIPENTAKNIEICIYNYIIDYCNKYNVQIDWENFLFKHMYVSKYIEIIQYLKHEPTLLDYIIKHKLSKQICDMSDNRYSENRNSDTVSKTIISETTIEDGLFKCPKCKSKKTTYYSVQLRSSDEPMTNFITCTSCKNRWKT